MNGIFISVFRISNEFWYLHFSFVSFRFRTIFILFVLSSLNHRSVQPILIKNEIKPTEIEKLFHFCFSFHESESASCSRKFHIFIWFVFFSFFLVFYRFIHLTKWCERENNVPCHFWLFVYTDAARKFHSKFFLILIWFFISFFFSLFSFFLGKYSQHLKYLEFRIAFIWNIVRFIVKPQNEKCETLQKAS